MTNLTSSMQSRGIVTVVQEHRFELFGEDGAYRHFTLAHDAPLGWKELVRLQRERCTVVVRHEQPQAGHSTSAVHAVARLAPGEASAPRHSGEQA